MFFIFFANCGDAFGKVVSDGMTIVLLQRLMFYIHHYCLMYYGCLSSKHIFTHNSILSYPCFQDYQRNKLQHTTKLRWSGEFKWW